MADGRTRTVESTVANVGELLANLSLTARPGDRLSVPASSALRDGERIVLQRLVRKSVTADEQVPFQTTTSPDPTQLVGQSTVVTPGKAGVTRLVYAVVYLDGTEIGRTLVSRTVVTAPVTKVVKAGSKPPPPVVVTTPPLPVVVTTPRRSPSTPARRRRSRRRC